MSVFIGRSRGVEWNGRLRLQLTQNDPLWLQMHTNWFKNSPNWLEIRIKSLKNGPLWHDTHTNQPKNCGKWFKIEPKWLKLI